MDINEALDFLKKCDNVNILTHKNPDGDTLGCGFALVNFLRSLGKKANVLNHGEFPKRYDFLYEGYSPMTFEEECVIAVDIADVKLLGDNLAEYKQKSKIDLCIDHHVSNTFYANHTLLVTTAAAASEVMFQLLKAGGAELSPIIAKCLYTGIATDTGCFKYENTTPETHEAAAELMRCGVEYAKINRAMFDVKSKGRLLVEQAAAQSMEYFFDDRCSMIVITTALIASSGISPADFDGLTAITLQAEGVQVGLLVKERFENCYKVSVRTTDEIDASAICSAFGGGGHVRAAGCEINGSLSEVKDKLLTACKAALGDA